MIVVAFAFALGFGGLAVHARELAQGPRQHRKHARVTLAFVGRLAGRPQPRFDLAHLRFRRAPHAPDHRVTVA
jgi:hypothetical protein